jgi:hypothetical protein
MFHDGVARVGALLAFASDASVAFVACARGRSMSTAPSVSVRLDEETMARLAREALQERRPKASLARLLIVDALADRERQGERVSTR